MTLSVLVGWTAASAARRGGDVRQEAAATPQTSTAAGVYSAPQATRGEETYMAICVACHPRGTYSTAAFKTAWTGRPLSELFDLVKEKMPKNDPASLTPAEYAQVIAYLLKINDVPAGEHELPPDSDALKKIRIEMPAGQQFQAHRAHRVIVPFVMAPSARAGVLLN
jgi:mono/diheme cytochrome c family protein